MHRTCSHQSCSIKKVVLENFAKFTRKYLCLSVLFNKVVGLTPATLLKKRLWHRCFPVSFAKLSRTLCYRPPPGDSFWPRSLLQNSEIFLLAITGKTVLVNSVQEIIEMEAWVLLRFYLCLHNQLDFIHSIVTYWRVKVFKKGLG